MSGDGSKIAVLANDGAIAFSTNSGVSFSVLSAQGSPLVGISISPNGSLFATATTENDYGEEVKVSTDNGVNFTSYFSFMGLIRSVSCYNGGVYVVEGFRLQKSTDGGASYSLVHTAPIKLSEVRCSTDGQTILLMGRSSDFDPIFGFVSTNGGSSFATISPSLSSFPGGEYAYTSPAVSGNGEALLCGIAASLYISEDSSTWSNTGLSGQFTGDTSSNFTAASFSGPLYAVAEGGHLYKGTASSAVTTVDETNSNVDTNTTWGDGATLDITVPATVESGATLTLNVPSIAALTGAGSITVNPGASVSITGPTGTRTVTVQEGTILKISTEGT
jgi:hypothetical protein